MGLYNSPDIFQEKMSELMTGLNFIRTCIDNLLCILHYARLTLRYDWLEGSQNAHTRFSFPGEIKFGYKARPWSVPTQMQEVDQGELAGNFI